MRRVGVLICLVIIFVSVSRIKANTSVTTPKVTVDDLNTVLIGQVGLGENTQALDKLEAVLAALNKKQHRYRKQEDFVEYLYFYTHRKLFKKYKQYPSVAETLSSGDYDCLTATTVYSILLNELSIPHVVVETNYHIYILVYPDTEKEILLEATDPNFGFKADKNEIERSKQGYRNANKELQAEQVNMNLDLERRLEGKEILGLLYYNLSIKELNSGNIKRSETLAKQAGIFYPNMRVTKLLEYIDTRISSASL